MSASIAYKVRLTKPNTMNERWRKLPSRVVNTRVRPVVLGGEVTARP